MSASAVDDPRCLLALAIDGEPVSRETDVGWEQIPALAEVAGQAEFPSEEQEAAAKEVVTSRWNEEMSG